jgi:Arc/MetJ-type ribon-helix-helix transcriptional regulator
MSTQITVRLPDELVAFADQQVESGAALSRAQVVTRALLREQRRALAVRDAEIYARHGENPELVGLTEHTTANLPDLD